MNETWYWAVPTVIIIHTFTVWVAGAVTTTLIVPTGKYNEEEVFVDGIGKRRPDEAGNILMPAIVSHKTVILEPTKYTPVPFCKTI